MTGDIVYACEGGITLAVRIEAPSPIERVDVMRGAEELRTLRSYGPEDLGWRVRVYWRGADYRGRGRNTLWQGTVDVEGAAIGAMEPVNH